MEANEVKEPGIGAVEQMIDPEKIIVVASDSDAASSILPDNKQKKYYENLNNRVIWITGEIDDSVYDIISLILDYNREDKDIDFLKRKPIRLVISSPGGSLDHARSLVSVINISKTPIHTIAVGCVASAASLIYLAGHLRYAIDFTYFVFHKGGVENLSGASSELFPFMDNYRQDIAEVVNLYKKFTTFDHDYIEEKLSKGDWYVRLDEAVENSVVDIVIDDIDDLT